MGAKISNWTYITTTKNETEMQYGLASRGPLSICVDACTRPLPPRDPRCRAPLTASSSLIGIPASWQYYIGGVITSLCEDSLDHCVMYVGYPKCVRTHKLWSARSRESLSPFPAMYRITGYSVQEGWDFMKYDVWNIRNSWGEDWGYGGYLYVQRGSNLCGTELSPSKLTTHVSTEE